MKNITFNFIKKNYIDLKKIDYINDNNYNSKDNQNQKRLLHFSLMKFIKTQYNKNKDILTKRSTCKHFFNKYNNLNLLPYLKKKINYKNSQKYFFYSTYAKFDGLNNIGNYEFKTNNINEYSSKRKNMEINNIQNNYKETDLNKKKIKKNRIKSSFESETLKYKNFYETRSERKKELNKNILYNNQIIKNNDILYQTSKLSNYNLFNCNAPNFKRKNSSKSNNDVYVKDEDIKSENKKNNSRADSSQIENSLNFNKNTNTYKNRIKNKIVNQCDKKYNDEFQIQNLKLGNNNQRFEKLFDRKNVSNNLEKNLTYREEEKDSNLIYSTPKKNSLEDKITKKSDSTENKSIDKNRITYNIKSIFERRKTFSTEIKNNSSNTIKNINIKKFKYNLKQAKNDFKNIYKNKYNKYEVIDSFMNTKEGSKISISEKNKTLINIKKKEKFSKLSINTNTKFSGFNKYDIKMIQPCQFIFLKNINNRKKNNNNDIIDLI